jgi:hypothetical protein
MGSGQRIVMNKPKAFLSAIASLPLMFAAADAVAATDAETPGEGPVLTRSLPAPAPAPGPRPGPGPWLVRAEGSLVDMRDNWLGMPGPEVGLTVGRHMTPRIAIEVTGSGREAESASQRSWSAMAVGRGVIVSNRTGRHALTFAGGPMVQIGHRVHGNLPFAHTELAYVYRSSFGLTALAGAGVNVALARSSYVEPPPRECPDSGDAIVFCIDLGPDAREIHEGDRTAHMRLAVGWQF